MPPISDPDSKPDLLLHHWRNTASSPSCHRSPLPVSRKNCDREQLHERKQVGDALAEHLIQSFSTSISVGFFMGWFILAYIFSTFLSLIQVRNLSDKDEDLEIVILRHQLAVMTWFQTKPVKPNRVEKMTLAMMTKKPKQSTNRSARQHREVIRIIHPDTVLRWYRESARRKWTYEQKNKGGHPKIHRCLTSYP